MLPATPASSRSDTDKAYADHLLRVYDWSLLHRHFPEKVQPAMSALLMGRHDDTLDDATRDALVDFVATMDRACALYAALRRRLQD